MGCSVKVNLGCGDRYVDGWINVDYGSPHQYDQQVDLRGPLPWPNGCLSRIYAGHLFEHLHPEECERLAAELLRCARPEGCVFVAVGPDLDLAERMVKDGTFDYTYHSLDSLRYGAGRWAGDVHLWETTGPAVQQLLQEAGWPVVYTLKIDELEGGWPVADPSQKWQYACRAWIGEFG